MILSRILNAIRINIVFSTISNSEVTQDEQCFSNPPYKDTDIIYCQVTILRQFFAAVFNMLLHFYAIKSLVYIYLFIG